MTTKTKKPVIHNTVKVKSLLFLEMRQNSKRSWATARQIANATGCNPDSLYVLLQRWYQWGLVNCAFESRPYVYSTAKEGERYLSKLDQWFFPGYYSRKRKERVHGYRGRVQDLQLEIAINCCMVYWWRKRESTGPSSSRFRGPVYWIEAPFTKAEHFKSIPVPEERIIHSGSFPNRHLLVVQTDHAHVMLNSAIQYRKKPFKKGDPLGEAVVASGIGVVWSKEEAE